FLGPGSTCAGSPCGAPPTGACCVSNGTCSSVTQAECNSQGGIFTPGAPCTPNPCGPGACCNGTTCNIRTAYDCIANGFDSFHGAGSTCTPNPCAAPTTGACCLGPG